MFYLETTFFSWNVMTWAVYFGFAALAVLIAVMVLKGQKKLSLTGSGECASGERQLFVSVLENCLMLFRMRTIDVWLGHSWLVAVSPLFFLALFLTAVFAR